MLVSIMLSSTVNAGLHTPGYIVTSSIGPNGDPYADVTMNFKHNPEAGSYSYIDVKKDVIAGDP